MTNRYLQIIGIFITLLSNAVPANAVCTGSFFHEDEACDSEIEKSLLPGKSKYISRNGSALKLKSLSPWAPSLTLTDESDARQLKHKLKAFYPRYSVSLVISKANEYFEAHLYFHNSGSLVSVPGEIAFSGSGELFVSYNWDLGCFCSSNSISVFEITEHNAFVLSTFAPKSFGVTKSKFLDDDRIEVSASYYNKNKNDFETSTCHLERRNSVWQFDDLACVDKSSAP